MLFSAANGQKVVSTSTAATIGKIHDYVIDPQGPKVVALLLKKAEDGDTLLWSDIVAFGADAVTVQSADTVTKGIGDELAPLLDKRNHLHKKRVLSTVGDELGSVKDIDFDPSTGTVTSLILDNKTEVAGARLVGVGSYAVVVEADTAGGPSPAPRAATQTASRAHAASRPVPSDSAPNDPAPNDPAPNDQVPLRPADPTDEPTSLNLSPSPEPALTLEPPDLSQTRRASYPPAE